jgi:hypothetical protein
VVGALAFLTVALAGAGAGQAGSYVHRWPAGPDGVPRHEAEPYRPQPGDLVFFDDHAWGREVCYWLAGSGPPFHSAIIVARPDGTPALLEAGPYYQPHVFLAEPLPRLRAFAGDVWIRRLRHPLSPGQSAVLTQFALSQEGKRYALCRLALQLTPFRCRGAWRIRLFGCTNPRRGSWLCSELVVAAGTAAGLFDPHLCPANAIYPRDLIRDETFDLSATWDKATLWTDRPGPVPGSPAAPR